MNKLTKYLIKIKLKELNSDWFVKDNKLILEYETQDYLDAVDKIYSIARKAEKLNHHPDIELYDYNKLKIILHTHDANGITMKDFELAHIIEGIIFNEISK